MNDNRKPSSSHSCRCHHQPSSFFIHSLFFNSIKMIKWYDTITYELIPKYLQTSDCFKPTTKTFYRHKNWYYRLKLVVYFYFFLYTGQQTNKQTTITPNKKEKKRYHHSVLFDFSSNIYWIIFCVLFICLCHFNFAISTHIFRIV